MQVPDRIADVQYLSDGSLTVCTGADHLPADHRRYFWSPDVGSPLVEVSLEQLDPEGHEDALLRRLRGIPFLHGRPLEESRRFEQHGGWLFHAGEIRSHRAFENPADSPRSRAC